MKIVFLGICLKIGKITKDNGYAVCEFVYPKALYSGEAGYVYYSVELATKETEEEIAERLYQSMYSDERSEFETDGYSSVYDTLQELCEDCGMPYGEITEAMNWQ